jgi:hypothetical protein
MAGYSSQTAPGVPGSFPLPNAGNKGNAYKANAMHPSAMAGRAGPQAVLRQAQTGGKR